jgi:hypothetical protein
MAEITSPHVISASVFKDAATPATTGLEYSYEYMYIYSLQAVSENNEEQSTT